ncbi:zinc-binding dehydrogenase [Streptomyces sp. 184]|uniref:zinc-binding dehydrogenase n=1 Tax=Streptomyces sp. 184 TaxID=1827526 RepID=UPI0038928524
MTAALPRTAREVRLAAAPDGLPGPGEVVVRNRYFLVFPGLRTVMGAEAEGMPLPPIRGGDTVYGPAVGEVVAAHPDAASVHPGDTVVHLRGRREYAVLPAAECAPADGTLPDPVAHLNQGAAAYGSLTRVAEVRADDTVLVTGAAGAVGTLAGQIARLLGAGRVIGTTRSAGKAGRLLAESGYDDVVVAGDGPFADRLAAAVPEGVDVVLDMVGGEQLAGAVASARPGARLALVGALSGQLSPERAGGSARFGDWLRSGAMTVRAAGHRPDPGRTRTPRPRPDRRGPARPYRAASRGREIPAVLRLLRCQRGRGPPDRGPRRGDRAADVAAQPPRRAAPPRGRAARPGDRFVRSSTGPGRGPRSGRPG